MFSSCSTIRSILHPPYALHHSPPAVQLYFKNKKQFWK